MRRPRGRFTARLSRSPPICPTPATASAACRPTRRRCCARRSRGTPSSCRWNAPPPDGLGAPTYRVVRKVGGTPSRVDDGTVVADVDSPEATDKRATPGQIVGYAVFTMRGAASATGATLAPFPFLLDVQDLRAEGERGEIRLSWTLPARDRREGCEARRHRRGRQDDRRTGRQCG